MKDYNLKKYYNNKHASKCHDLDGHFWSDKSQQLKSQYSGQQTLLLK
jgi:hypothetical protein